MVEVDWTLAGSKGCGRSPVGWGRWSFVQHWWDASGELDPVLGSPVKQRHWTYWSKSSARPQRSSDWNIFGTGRAWESLEKRRLGGGLIYLLGKVKNTETGFSQCCPGTGLEARDTNQNTRNLNIGRNVFTVREVKHWHRLHREAVVSPSLGVFRTRQDAVLADGAVSESWAGWSPEVPTSPGTPWAEVGALLKVTSSCKAPALQALPLLKWQSRQTPQAALPACSWEAASRIEEKV